MQNYEKSGYNQNPDSVAHDRNSDIFLRVGRPQEAAGEIVIDTSDVRLAEGKEYFHYAFTTFPGVTSASGRAPCQAFGTGSTGRRRESDIRHSGRLPL